MRLAGIFILACFAALSATACITVHHVVTIEVKRPDWLPRLPTTRPTTQPADDIQTVDEIIEEIIRQNGGIP